MTTCEETKKCEWHVVNIKELPLSYILQLSTTYFLVVVVVVVVAGSAKTAYIGSTTASWCYKANMMDT